MAGKINLAIFAARNSRTSTISNRAVLTILGSLDPTAYRISLVLIDDLIPEDLVIAEEVLSKDPTYIPFTEVEGHANLFHVYMLSSLSLAQLKSLFDVALIAVYNDFGEDGRLTGLLETIGIPFISPHTKTTAICFDKDLAKNVLRGKGITVPKGFEIHKSAYDVQSLDQRITGEFGYPIIIKASSNGASRGVSLVQNKNDLSEATENAFHFSEDCLVEEYLKGREFSVGVIGHYLEAQALPVAEIIAHNEFFDYESKYMKGKAEEVCPAKIEDVLRSRLQETAVKAYQAVKAEGQAKVDMILKDNTVYVLEVNTLPSFLPVSIFPQELRASGMTLAAYLERAIKSRLKPTILLD